MSYERKFVRSFLLGFLLGGVLVYAGLHFYRFHCGFPGHAKRLSPDKTKILNKLNRELKLDAGQQDRVDKILAAHLPKIKELREAMRPQLKAARELMQAEISGTLFPEQKEKFSRIVAEFEKKKREQEER